MSKLSFSIKNSIDYLQSLFEANEGFKKDNLSSIKATDCATRAWHLVEWVFKEYQHVHQANSLGDFRATLFPVCPSLKIMHDIANASKHYELERPKANLREARKHNGSFSRGFSRGFDISILEIELEDGTILYFEDEIEKVVEFWKLYFINTLNINFYE